MKTYQFMGEYLFAFTQALEMFGKLQYYLDRDTGIAFPYPYIELLPNLGDGEVVMGLPLQLR